MALAIAASSRSSFARGTQRTSTGYVRPVLSTTGEFDEVGPKTVEAHARLIPGAKFILYKDAAHVTSWDARDANVKDVREFLRKVDARR